MDNSSRKVIRTTNKNEDFKRLVSNLNAYLKIVDGDDHEFYMQYNGLDDLSHVVVAYDEGVACACGALKRFDDSTFEIKRMFVAEDKRGTGIAKLIIEELEEWAREENAERCVLETGSEMKPAIRFYTKMDYLPIERYGQYEDVETSVCFEKSFIH